MFETLTCLNNAVLNKISVAYTHTNTHAHTRSTELMKLGWHKTVELTSNTDTR